MTDAEVLAVLALLNSYVADYLIRQTVSANLNMFYVYQLPVPRLSEQDPEFAPIVERAARLVCTAPEFDRLARGVGLKDHTEGTRDEAERARLRAELDGLVARLYGLDEEAFAHVLSTFPLVGCGAKEAALGQFRRLASVL